jgi:uncharacterized membrane protein
MIAILAAGGSMAFEAAKGAAAEPLGAAGVALFAFGALAFGGVAVLLIASRAASERCDAALGEAAKRLREEEPR